MQDEPKPTLAQQIQEAVDRGQVVLIPAPAQNLHQQDAPATPLPRNRDETSLVAVLCMLFGLKHSEARMLMRLLAQDYSTKGELSAAASGNDQPIAAGTTNVFISSLRKKLNAFGVRIATIPTLGYGLDGSARAKVHELLAEHDAAFVLRSPGAKSEAPQGDLFKSPVCPC